MGLKRLVLQGYKTFVTKTEFVFDEGITAVSIQFMQAAAEGTGLIIFPGGGKGWRCYTARSPNSNRAANNGPVWAWMPAA